jgi:hypothetical protein
MTTRMYDALTRKFAKNCDCFCHVIYKHCNCDCSELGLIAEHDLFPQKQMRIRDDF